MEKKESKYHIAEIYNQHGLKIVRYTHQNSAQTYRAFYKGKSDNPMEILSKLHNYRNEILQSFHEKEHLGSTETLDSYLSRTDDIEYVDNLGSINDQGVILGAYVPSKDKRYILRNIPYVLVDAINKVRPSQLEQILGEESSKHRKKVSAYDIQKFGKTHEAVHRRRTYTGESQNEEDIDLEAAIVSGNYPIVRFPRVLKDMHDPKIKETILSRPGIEYVRRKAA